MLRFRSERRDPLLEGLFFGVLVKLVWLLYRG